MEELDVLKIKDDDDDDGENECLNLRLSIICNIDVKKLLYMSCDIFDKPPKWLKEHSDSLDQKNSKIAKFWMGFVF